ncbi:MAG TPA: oligosaccharide flippase family protein, partial [Nitrososphaeraceae archaeon]|nr:oligosaccharide flippase family protein [Nitrososphaeraceae archaeon]
MHEEHNTFSPFITARGTLYLVAKAIVAAASAGIFFIAIARSLPTVSELGLFQGLQYLITISVTLAGSGLSRASVRYISVYIGAGKENIAKKIHLSVFIMGLGLSALFSIMIYASANYLSFLLFHDIAYAYVVQLASVDVFLFTMIIYSTSLLYALQAFSKVVIISIVNSLLKFSVAFSLVLLGMSIGGIIIGFIAGDALGLTLFLYALMPKFLKTRLASLVEIKPLFSYSLPLYGHSVLLYISTEMDVYLLLILSSLSTVGTYSPAVLIGTVLFLLLTALDQSIAPLFSRIYGRSGLKSLSELSRFASRYIFLIYLPIGFA